VANLLINSTTTMLLEGLLDPTQQSIWREFDDRFRPIILGVALRAGLSEHDAEDVAQQTLCEFSRDFRLGKYDRTRGRLRSWILGIARHRIIDVQRELQRRRERRGESAFVNLADQDELENYWQLERDQRLAALAWDELKNATKTSSSTLQVFVLFAVQQVPAEEVARQCGIETPEVYRIKHRLTHRLQEIVKRLESAFEDGK